MVADDTDIFVLLCHFLFLGVIKNHVLMTSPIRDRAVIDINRTVRNNFGLMSNLLAAHGLTGCDTVATFFGIGKGIALKVLKTNCYPLDKLGNMNC